MTREWLLLLDEAGLERVVGKLSKLPRDAERRGLTSRRNSE
jgi:hypothetical protein